MRGRLFALRGYDGPDRRVPGAPGVGEPHCGGHAIWRSAGIRRSWRLSSRRERSAPTCPPGRVSSSSEKREKKCSRTTPRWVPRASSQALAAALGEAGIGAPRVVVAGAALQQPVALEAVDEPGQAAARELGLLGQFAHPHSPAGAPPRDGAGPHRRSSAGRGRGRAPRRASWPGRRGPAAVRATPAAPRG